MLRIANGQREAERTMSYKDSGSKASFPRAIVMTAMIWKRRIVSMSKVANQKKVVEAQRKHHEELKRRVEEQKREREARDKKRS